VFRAISEYMQQWTLFGTLGVAFAAPLAQLTLWAILTACAGRTIKRRMISLKL
jgi:hypothetical protein